MLLVDPKVMEQLKQSSMPPPPPIPDTLSDSLTALDNDIRTILNKKYESAYEKALEYQQSLQRYLTLADQYRQRTAPIPRPLSSDTTPTAQQPVADQDTTTPTSMVNKWNDKVLETVPPTMKPKATQLLSFLKDVDGDILRWSPRGEMVYRGQVIEGSHIIDLVNDALRKRSTFPDPKGWEKFAAALKKSNIPSTLIGHRDRWRWMQKQDATSSSSSSSSSSSLSPSASPPLPGLQSLDTPVGVATSKRRRVDLFSTPKSSAPKADSDDENTWTDVAQKSPWLSLND